MFLGDRWFSKPDGCNAECSVRDEEKRWISHTLRQVEELLGEPPSFLVLGPDQVKRPQSEEDRKELRRLTDLTTEL
jgi:hypothetical protein